MIRQQPFDFFEFANGFPVRHSFLGQTHVVVQMGVDVDARDVLQREDKVHRAGTAAVETSGMDLPAVTTRGPIPRLLEGPAGCDLHGESMSRASVCFDPARDRKSVV